MRIALVPARRPVGAATSSRAPRGDRPPGRTPRASACGCIEHSAERRPQGAALIKYGNSNHDSGHLGVLGIACHLHRQA